MTTTEITLSQSLLSFLTYLASNTTFQQFVPLVILLTVPLLVLVGRNYFRCISSFALHMLAVASSTLPWNWLSAYEHGTILSKSTKKHSIRTRAQQLAARPDNGCTGAYGTHPLNPFETLIFPSEVEKKTLFYPGLVNLSGTYCFMNSTMQVCSSCPALLSHPLPVPLTSSPLHFPPHRPSPRFHTSNHT
jgi:hypothetical protein